MSQNIQFINAGSTSSFHGDWDDVKIAVHGGFLVFVGRVTTEEGAEFIQARALDFWISGKYGPSVEVGDPYEGGGDTPSEKLRRKDAAVAERTVEAAYEAEFGA